MSHDTGIRGIKVQVQVAKWENNRTPADGPPDLVEDVSYWSTADGREITDPETIADLERRALEQGGANG